MNISPRLQNSGAVAHSNRRYEKLAFAILGISFCKKGGADRKQRGECLMKKFQDLSWEKKEKIYRAVIIVSIIVLIISTVCNIYAYRTFNTIYELMEVEKPIAF